MTQGWTKPISRLYGEAASYYHGHPAANKPKIAYESVPDTAHSTPLQHSAEFSKPVPANVASRKRTLGRLKRSLRGITIFSLVASTLLTAALEACMIYIVYKYLSTRHTPASDGSRASPWAHDSITWPTYMLLAASAITLVLCAGLLIAACCRSRKRAMFSLALSIVQIVVWVVVTILYRVMKVERDLWGWACHPKAAAIQPLYDQVLNFDSLCKVQVSLFSSPDMWRPCRE
jgi:small-conductance mechanosensitive channel